jgi:hypothetical protein
MFKYTFHVYGYIGEKKTAELETNFEHREIDISEALRNIFAAVMAGFALDVDGKNGTVNINGDCSEIYKAIGVPRYIERQA